jgi:hypothetical protein
MNNKLCVFRSYKFLLSHFASRNRMLTTSTGGQGIYSIDPTSGLDDEQKEIYDMASKFAKTKMKPFMAEWDKKEVLPVDVLKEAGLSLLTFFFKSDS